MDDTPKDKNNLPVRQEPPEELGPIDLSSLEVMIGTHSFKDIGGLSKQVDTMKKFAMAIGDSRRFERYGINPPKGILLWGGPGRGKSQMAKAFASEIKNYIPTKDLDTTQVIFTELNLEDFVSKYVGETSKNLNKILGGYTGCIEYNKRKGMNTKVIVYLDEIDSIGGKRDESHEAYQKMLGVLLKYMDGIHSSDGLYFIGSTNRKDSLDKAFIRPGRFDKLIAVDKYDKGGIRDIFKIHMKKQQKSALETLYSRMNWKKIEGAISSHNPSGAEIEEILRASVEYSLWKEVEEGVKKIPLKTKHILKEIELFYKGRKDGSKRLIGYNPKDENRR